MATLVVDGERLDLAPHPDPDTVLRHAQAVMIGAVPDEEGRYTLPLAAGTKRWVNWHAVRTVVAPEPEEIPADD